MKYSTLFRLLTILGSVFLASVLLVAYLDSVSSLIIFGSILAQLSLEHFGFLFVFSGIVLLAVGVVGIKRHFFHSHGTFLSAFSIPLISLLIFCSFFFAYFSILASAPMFPMRSEITQVTVVDSSPLVLSVGVKAITSSDSRIDQAIVINSNDRIVAETSFDDREWFELGAFKGLALAVLPGGSEITLTLNFNATLPSGSYLVRLACWGDNHGDSPFTIP